MDFLPEEVDNFVSKNTENEPDILNELNHANTHDNP